MKYLLFALLLVSCRTVKQDCPIGMSYEETQLHSKVLRKWTVVRWCEYDGNGKGIRVYNQVDDIGSYPCPPKRVYRQL